MLGRKRCLCSCLFKVKWFKGKKGAKDVFVHASDKNMGTPKGKVKWFNFAKVSSNVTTVSTLKGKVKWFNKSAQNRKISNSSSSPSFRNL